MMVKAVLIPADVSKPVQEVSFNDTDYRNLTALIFDGSRDGTFDRMATANSLGAEVTFWFDDNGLARLESEDLADVINLRAMELYAHYEGMGRDPLKAIDRFNVPLVGDYVITGGADEEGNDLDVPFGVAGFPFTWPGRVGVRRGVSGAGK